MSSTLQGWVEVTLADKWDGVLRARHVIQGYRDTFAYLFGLPSTLEMDEVMREIVPLASGRGFPPDLSLETRIDILTEGTLLFFSPVSMSDRIDAYLDQTNVEQHFRSLASLSHPSYLLYEEIKHIDLDRPLEGSPVIINRYDRSPDGTIAYGGLAVRDGEFAVVNNTSAGALQDIRDLKEGQVQDFGPIIYRAERLSARHLLGSDWRLLFDLMAQLAGFYGDDHVRLVAWFAS